MKIIAGPASKELAEAVSAQTGFQNIPVISKIFPDGEFRHPYSICDVQTPDHFIMGTRIAL